MKGQGFTASLRGGESSRWNISSLLQSSGLSPTLVGDDSGRVLPRLLCEISTQRTASPGLCSCIDDESLCSQTGCHMFLDLNGTQTAFTSVCWRNLEGKKNDFLKVNTIRLFILVTCLLLPPAHTSSQDFQSTSPSMLFCTSPGALLGVLLLERTDADATVQAQPVSDKSSSKC